MTPLPLPSRGRALWETTMTVRSLPSHNFPAVGGFLRLVPLLPGHRRSLVVANVDVPDLRTLDGLVVDRADALDLHAIRLAGL
jgi:hypothetical protein